MGEAGRISRRNLVGGSVGAALAALAAPRPARAARDSATAAITGFSIINTLDPGKASLIQEYFVLWAAFNALLKFDDKMNVVPDLAESVQSCRPANLRLSPAAGG